MTQRLKLKEKIKGSDKKLNNSENDCKEKIKRTKENWDRKSKLNKRLRDKKKKNPKKRNSRLRNKNRNRN